MSVTGSTRLKLFWMVMGMDKEFAIAILKMHVVEIIKMVEAL